MGAPQVPADRLSSGWREHLVVKLTALDSDAAALQAGRFKDLALNFLTSARGAAERTGNVTAGWTGADVERAWVCTHAARWRSCAAPRRPR